MRIQTVGWSLLAALLCSVSSVLAQPDTLWSRTVNFTAQTTLKGITELSDGSYAAVGTAGSGSSATIFVTRVNSSGETVWSHDYPLSDFTACEGTSVVETPDGLIRAAGSGGGGHAVILLDINLDGDLTTEHAYATMYNQMARGYGIAACPDGSMGIVGAGIPTWGASQDLWLVYLDSAGDTVWTHGFGDETIETGYGILARPGGGFAMCGLDRATDTGDDPWLLIVDSTGTEMFSQTYPSTGDQTCAGLTMSSMGHYFLTGFTFNEAHHRVGYVTKTAPNGAQIWQQTYSSGLADERFYGIAPRLDGGVVCVGLAALSIDTLHFWVTSINPDGSVLWSSQFGPNNGQLFGVTRLSTGGYVACGSLKRTGLSEGYLLRFVGQGGVRGTIRDARTLQPVTNVSVEALGTGFSIPVNAAGGYVMELSSGMYDLVVYGPCIATDTIRQVAVSSDSMHTVNFVTGVPNSVLERSSLNIMTRNRIAGHDSIKVRNTGYGNLQFSIDVHARRPATPWLSVSPASGLIAAGDSLELRVTVLTDTSGQGNYDYQGELVIHTNSCPDTAVHVPVMATVLDADQRPDYAEQYLLESAFPNPFNPTTVISYVVPRTAAVHLTVYDILGHEVRTLVNGEMGAGKHLAVFDGSGLASGVYIVKMASGEFSGTQKLLLMK
jgi:hypothetical protein